MAPSLALNHRGRPPVLTITSRDSSVVGGRSPAAFTWTYVHLDSSLCSLLLLLPLKITAGEVLNELRSGPDMKTYCDAVTAIRRLRRKSWACMKTVVHQRWDGIGIRFCGSRLTVVGKWVI